LRCACPVVVAKPAFCAKIIFPKRLLLVATDFHDRFPGKGLNAQKKQESLQKGKCE